MELSQQKTAYKIDYRAADVRCWIIFLCRDFGTKSLSNKSAYYHDLARSLYFVSAFNSNLFWWYYAVNYDMFNLKDYMIFNFCLDYDNNIDCSALSQRLEEDMNANKISQTVVSKTSGVVQTAIFRKKLSKPIIDEIDKVLAKHYGFTEEELDFIINYDIKCRMGDELNE